MRKYGKRMVLAMTLLVCVLGGIYWIERRGIKGSMHAQEQVAPNIKETNKKIAVVNLDVGIEKQNQQINYGSILLERVGSEIEITGLEDARQGIRSNLYGAYMIIPTTFSENVESILVAPQKSTLTYALSSNLESLDREEVKAEVQSIYDAFRANISQVYTSTILSEYHFAQDESTQIMARDQQDMEMLEGIRGEDLLELITISEMTTVENTIQELDLLGDFTHIQNLIEMIDYAYQGYLEQGEVQYDEMKQGLEDLTIQKEETAHMLFEVNDYIAGLVRESTGAQGEAEDALYEEIRNNLLTIGEILVSKQEIANLNMSNMQKEIHVLREERQAKIQAIIDEYEGLLQEELEEAADTKEDTETSHMRNFITALEKQLKEWEDEEKHVNPIQIQAINYNASIGATQIQEITALEDFESELDVLIDTAKASRESRETALETIYAEVGQWRDQVSLFTDKYQMNRDEYHMLSKEFMEYNPHAYIDQTEITTHVSDISRSNSDIENKIHEQNSQYEQYVMEIYQVAKENINDMQINVSEGEQASKLRLEEGLSTAKRFRREHNESNTLILKDFATRLPYTRIGELENKEVYDFITTPLALSEQTEITMSTPVPQIQERTTHKEPSNVIPLVISILVVGISAVGITYSVKRRKMKEEF
jgi:hypothetical protein